MCCPSALCVFSMVIWRLFLSSYGALSYQASSCREASLRVLNGSKLETTLLKGVVLVPLSLSYTSTPVPFPLQHFAYSGGFLNAPHMFAPRSFWQVYFPWWNIILRAGLFLMKHISMASIKWIFPWYNKGSQLEMMLADASFSCVSLNNIDRLALTAIAS